MNKILLFGSSFVATAANPTLTTSSSERRLDNTWGAGNVGATAGANSQNCIFRSTNDLFDHTWIQTEASADGSTPKIFDEDDEWTNLISTTNDAAWKADPLLIARIEVDLKLTNYEAVAQTPDTKNYKYYDWVAAGGGSWIPTKLDHHGEEQMVAICVYKNSKPNSCEADDILVELEDGVTDYGNTVYEQEYSGTEKTVDVGIRKVLGVASSCGVSGDLQHLGDGSEDIFVWAHLEATAQLKFKLSFSQLEPEVTDEQALDAGYDIANDNIQYTLTVTTNEPETHDLLFIEAPAELTSTLFTDHPDSDVDGVSEYKVIAGDQYSSTGGITITDPGTAMTCGLELTVQSQVGNHWHCFRSADGQKNPGIKFSTDFDTTDDGDAAITTGIDYGTDTATINDNCAAKLDVTCTSAVSLVSGVDTRECRVSVLAGMSNAVLATRLADYRDCVSKSWFDAAPTFYDGHVPITGYYSTAIVEAVRLTNDRRYPKDAHSASYQDVNGASVFPVEQTNQFMCGDATNDCATQDPFVVLDANKVEATLTFEHGIGPFKTQTEPYDATASALVDPATGVLDYFAKCTGGTGVQCSREDTSTYTQCTGASTENTCDADGPDYHSGWKNLVIPPANYPQVYVFGAASFDFVVAEEDGSTAQSQEMVNPVDSQQPAAPATRRLHSHIKTAKATRKTLFVNALQNVVQK